MKKKTNLSLRRSITSVPPPTTTIGLKTHNLARVVGIQLLEEEISPASVRVVRVNNGAAPQQRCPQAERAHRGDDVGRPSQKGHVLCGDIDAATLSPFSGFSPFPDPSSFVSSGTPFFSLLHCGRRYYYHVGVPHGQHTSAPGSILAGHHEGHTTISTGV